jgi:hypothetical protein
MRKVMEMLDVDLPLTGTFDIKGSLGDWLEALPNGMRTYIDEHIEEGSRQILIEKEK